MEIQREITEIQDTLKTIVEIQGRHAEILRTQQAIESQRETLNRSLAKLPDNAVLACAFYGAARSEILQRLGMRETTFTFWVTTVGVVVSLSVKAASQSAGLPALDARTLGLIPIMSLPFTLLVTRQSMIIGWISRYVRDDLNWLLRQSISEGIDAANAGPRHWDNSSKLQSRIGLFLFFESLAYYLFLVGPAAAVELYRYISDRNALADLWFWGGLVCAAAAFLICVARFVVDLLPKK
jgi:hypothetical protein